MSSTFISDPSKTPEQMLVDLINHANEVAQMPRRFAYNTLYFQNAKEYVTVAAINGAGGYATTEGYDTEVQVTEDPMADSNDDSEWFKFFYNRAKLAQAFNRRGISPSMPYDAGFATTHDMLSALNAFFGLGLTTNDIKDEALPTFVSYPLAVTLKAKPGSLIYVGETQVYLGDPASSEYTTRTVTVASNASIDAAFDRSFALPLTHYQVADNSEVEVASACYMEPGDVACTITGNTYLVDFSSNKHWEYFGSIGLLGASSGQVADKYIIKLDVFRSDGRALHSFKLTLNEAGEVGFLSVDRSIWIPAEFVDGSDLVQFKIVPTQCYALFVNYMSTADGSIIGEFEMRLSAVNRRKSLPAVVSTIRIKPDIHAVDTVALVNMYGGDPTSSNVSLAGSGDTLVPFRCLVHVKTRGGLRLPLESDHDYDVVLTSPATVSATSASGITMNGTTLHLPAGLATGSYEIAGQVILAAGWDLDAVNAVTLAIEESSIVKSSLTWSLS